MDLLLLDEAQEIYTQQRCQAELDRLLDDLCHVVTWARIADTEKLRLIAGLAQLRGHVHAETNNLVSEMKWRAN